MTTKFRHGLLYAGLFVLYLLHNDLWYWNDARLMFGLPIGLAYHIAFSLVTAVFMFLLVTYAWPRHLEVEDEQEHRP